MTTFQCDACGHEIPLSTARQTIPVGHAERPIMTLEIRAFRGNGSAPAIPADICPGCLFDAIRLHHFAPTCSASTPLTTAAPESVEPVPLSPSSSE